MPTYEYKCEKCGLTFERRQAITAEALTECPECHGTVSRLVSGGTGFIMKDAGPSGEKSDHGGCSLEQTGRTCCGREQRCGKPSCGD
jgi:putative FmdB family regulatory protein